MDTRSGIHMAKKSRFNPLSRGSFSMSTLSGIHNWYFNDMILDLVKIFLFPLFS